MNLEFIFNLKCIELHKVIFELSKLYTLFQIIINKKLIKNFYFSNL